MYLPFLFLSVGILLSIGEGVNLAYLSFQFSKLLADHIDLLIVFASQVERVNDRDGRCSDRSVRASLGLSSLLQYALEVLQIAGDVLKLLDLALQVLYGVLHLLYLRLILAVYGGLKLFVPSVELVFHELYDFILFERIWQGRWRPGAINGEKVLCSLAVMPRINRVPCRVRGVL